MEFWTLLSHGFQQQFFFLFNIVVAMLISAIVGWERQTADKPAGLRTHVVVAAASAALVMLSMQITEIQGSIGSTKTIQADPTRVFVAIVTGISFIGAGTIIRTAGRRSVEGVTTAASLLLTATVGICVGLYQYIQALGLALIAVAGLRLLGKIGYRQGWNQS